MPVKPDAIQINDLVRGTRQHQGMTITVELRVTRIQQDLLFSPMGAAVSSLAYQWELIARPKDEAADSSAPSLSTEDSVSASTDVGRPEDGLGTLGGDAE